MSKEWKNYFKWLVISGIPAVLVISCAVVLGTYMDIELWDWFLMLGGMIMQGYLLLAVVSLIAGFAVGDRRLKYGWFGTMTPGIAAFIAAATYGIGLVLVPIVILIFYVATNAKERKMEQEASVYLVENSELLTSDSEKE